MRAIQGGRPISDPAQADRPLDLVSRNFNDEASAADQVLAFGYGRRASRFIADVRLRGQGLVAQWQTYAAITQREGLW